MSVVTTNVKVTDLGSKEADELEVETDVWTKQRQSRPERLYTPSCKTNHSFHALCGSFIKHSKLNADGLQPREQHLPVFSPRLTRTFAHFWDARHGVELNPMLGRVPPPVR